MGRFNNGIGIVRMDQRSHIESFLPLNECIAGLEAMIEGEEIHREEEDEEMIEMEEEMRRERKKEIEGIKIEEEMVEMMEEGKEEMRRKREGERKEVSR